MPLLNAALKCSLLPEVSADAMPGAGFLVDGFLTRLRAGSLFCNCYKGPESATHLQMSLLARTNLAVLGEVDEENFRHFVKAEGLEGIQDIVSGNSLAFLAYSPIGSLRGDEADEFGGRLLDAFWQRGF